MGDKENTQQTAVETKDPEEEKSLTDHLNKTLLESFLKRINSGESAVPQFESRGELDEQWRDDELANKQNGTL